MAHDVQRNGCPQLRLGRLSLSTKRALCQALSTRHAPVVSLLVVVAIPSKNEKQSTSHIGFVHAKRKVCAVESLFEWYIANLSRVVATRCCNCTRSTTQLDTTRYYGAGASSRRWRALSLFHGIPSGCHCITICGVPSFQRVVQHGVSIPTSCFPAGSSKFTTRSQCSGLAKVS